MGKKTAAKRYYVVWRGRKQGIFEDWESCKEAVEGFPGAQFMGFESREAAEQALQRPYAEVVGERSRPHPVAAGVPQEGYCVDAAYDTARKRLEYRCVRLYDRKEIFREGPFPDGSNNIGEFLAIVETLMLLQKTGDMAPVYSDSEVALLWVKRRRCGTHLPRTADNAPIFERIARAETWLRENQIRNPLLKWETGRWGENPADFGRK